MNRFIRILSILLIASIPAFAQEEELGTEAGPDPASVPVDGGLSLLLAAGVTYGGRKLYRKGIKKR